MILLGDLMVSLAKMTDVLLLASLYWILKGLVSIFFVYLRSYRYLAR